MSNVEAVVQRCSVKKVFMGISQNSQENTCARVSFLIKLQASGTVDRWFLSEHLFLQNTSGMVFLPNFSFDLLYYLHNYKFVYSINSCNRIVKAELEISCATPRLNWILLKRNIVKSCGYYDNMVRAFLLHRFIVATFLADTEANKKNNFIFLSFNTSEKVRLWPHEKHIL